MMFSITKNDDRQSTGSKLVAITFAGILAIMTMYSAGVFAVNPTHYAYAQQQSLIGNVNIPVNVDVTLIAPININIQNAQICVQVAGGSCSQVVLNPTQTTYSPTTVDLTQPTPTVTPTPTTSSPATTTPPGTTPTTTAAQPTTTVPSTGSPTTTTPGTTSTTNPSTTPTPPTSTTPPTTTSQPPTSGSGTSGGSSGSTGSSGGGSGSGGSSGSTGGSGK